jgi:hypothetical protein
VAADGADGVADDDRSCAVWPVGAADDVLAIDETGFVKKRIRSAEGQRQYSGAAGGGRELGPRPPASPGAAAPAAKPRHPGASRHLVMLGPSVNPPHLNESA